MPRPIPPGGPLVTVGVRISQSDLERLDAAADGIGYSRAEALKEAVSSWLEGAEGALEPTGPERPKAPAKPKVTTASPPPRLGYSKAQQVGKAPRHGAR